MQGMLLPTSLVLVFAASVLGGQAVFSAVVSSRTRRRRVNRRLTMLEQGMAPNEVYRALIRHDARTIRGPIGPALEQLSLYLSQAGLSISPLRLLAYDAVASVGLWLLATVLFGAFGQGALLSNLLTTAAASFTLVTVAIWVWVSRAHARRIRRLEEQLPLALDIIVRALKAGHPVISAVQLVTQEMGDPIGTEFGLIVDETTYGFEFREALGNFARRTGSEDAHFFAVSVGIQSETGGNLAEILANLATVIRSRIGLGKRVQALASEGKMSAIVLSILPIFMVSVVGLTQPAFYTSKFSDPIFWPVVVATLGLYVLGQFIMNRIVNFKY